MELQTVKPSKQTRINMALRAMTTVDATVGKYRATSSPNEKMAWMRETWNNPQVHTWCGQYDAPNINYKDGTGTYRFGRQDGDLTYWFGRQPMTDTDLASAFAYSARYAGWPHGSRPASGLVHDPAMAMLSIIALWVHSPARAKELHDLYQVLNINIQTPVGGWDPTTWVAVK